MRTPKQRLMAKVEIRPDGCWIFNGATQTNGYGSFGVDGKPVLAHRASYIIFVGPIPEGMTLDHRCHSDSTDCAGGLTCRHRKCVNPQHLEPVSVAENNRRGLSPTAINGRRTHCVNGHLLDEANTIRKKDGHRNCRTCQYACNRASYARRRAALAT